MADLNYKFNANEQRVLHIYKRFVYSHALSLSEIHYSIKITLAINGILFILHNQTALKQCDNYMHANI